jgi:hypothetical protein
MRMVAIILIGLAWASPLRSQTSPLADVADGFIGTWIVTTQLSADTSFGAKGTTATEYSRCRWIERSGVECDSNTLGGSEKELLMWDPVAKRIRTVGFGADGGSWDGTLRRDGEKLILNATYSMADGKAMDQKFEVTFQSRNEFTVAGVYTIEGVPQEMRKVYHRVAP